MAATRGRCVAGMLAGIVALALPAPGQGQDEAPQPVVPPPAVVAPPPEPVTPPETATATVPAPPETATATVPAPSTPEKAPAAGLLPGGVHVGIADQKFDMFTDERFAELGIRHARLAIPWDGLRHDWQVEQLDAWLAGAKALGVQPLISFGHSRTNRRSVPTPMRMRLEFRKLRKRYPWVTTYATWNEANHCGEPLCHRAPLAAAYYRALRAECPSCTILAPEILDMPNAVRWVNQFRRTLRFTPKIWGVHNYVEANRFRMSRLRALLRALPGANVWLTETGGLVRRDNASTTDIPEGPRHAAAVTRYLFDQVLPRNPRVKAVYLYHWNAGPEESTWDSGLITPGGNARSSLSVLRRVLHTGLRPRANYRAPGR